MILKSVYFIIIMIFSSFSVCQATELEDLISKYSKIYIKNSEGRKLFRGIIKVESNDGKYIIGGLDPSFGASQMKVSAVKDASRYFKIVIPESDDKIIWKLLKDTEFSIKMGAAYFGLLERKFKDVNDIKVVVIAYNEGYRSVRDKLRTEQELSTKYIDKVRLALEKKK